MKEENEIWKAIPGYEGCYEVSSEGRVKSLSRKGRKTPRILKTSMSNRYKKVQLSRGCKVETWRVSMLIATAFLGHKSNGHTTVVDHIDNDPLNDSLSNIQLISHRENLSKDRKGTSQYPGVYWSTGEKKWKACIHIKGKNKHLGTFISEIAAANAYQEMIQH